MSNLKASEIELEAEEHSLSLSQHSSPSHSDQEQTPVKKAQMFPLFKPQSPGSGHWGNQTNQRTMPIRGDPRDLCFLGENLNHSKPEQNPRVVHMGRRDVQCSPEPRHFQNMV